MIKHLIRLRRLQELMALHDERMDIAQNVMDACLNHDPDLVDNKEVYEAAFQMFNHSANFHDRLFDLWLDAGCLKYFI